MELQGMVSPRLVLVGQRNRTEGVFSSPATIDCEIGKVVHRTSVAGIEVEEIEFDDLASAA
jgi:hypothetical protein